jgi:hypothetical protein
MRSRKVGVKTSPRSETVAERGTDVMEREGLF